MTAVLATFVDARSVKSRSVMQLVLELPIEQADAALKALGGWPRPAESRWVGVALAPKEREQAAKKERRDWPAVSPTEQAGIRCNEPTFWAYLNTLSFVVGLNNEDAAEVVREICGVKSRKELNTVAAAGRRWTALEGSYQQYLVDQRYSASVNR